MNMIIVCIYTSYKMVPPYIFFMLIASKSQIEIENLKTPMKQEFEMKLGDANKIPGMEKTQDRNLRILYLTQKQYLRKLVKCFGTDKKSKPISIPLAPHFKFNAFMSLKNNAE